MPTYTPIGTVVMSPATATPSASMNKQRLNYADDASDLIQSTFGFTFPFYDKTFTQMYIGSNSYVTRNQTTAYSSINGATDVGIFVAARDNSFKYTYWKTDPQNKFFTIRYEGNSVLVDQAPTLNWEVKLFVDGTIQLVTDAAPNFATGSGAVSFLSNGVADTSVCNFSPVAGQSYVFVPNSNFTAYTVNTGASYSLVAGTQYTKSVSDGVTVGDNALTKVMGTRTNKSINDSVTVADNALAPIYTPSTRKGGSLFTNKLKVGAFAVNHADPFDSSTYDMRADMLIMASELTSIGLSAGDKIANLSFGVDTSPGTAPYVHIGMKNTALINLTGFATYSTLTEVYVGELVTTSGWSDIALTTNFTWDGTSNILLAVYRDDDMLYANPGFLDLRDTTYGYTRYWGFAGNDTSTAPFDSAAGTGYDGTMPSLKLFTASAAITTKTLTDSVSFSSDSITRRAVIRNTSDSTSLSDTIRKDISASKNDSLTLADSLAKAFGSVKVLTDSVTASDTLSKRLSAFKTLVDTQSLAESFSQRFSGFKSLTDSIAMSESFTKKWTATVFDTIPTADSKRESTSKAYSDTITAADSAITTVKGKVVNLTDAISIVETIRKAFVQTRTDTISVTDALLSGGVRFVSLSDSFTLTDTLRKAWAGTRTDSQASTDTIGKAWSGTRTDSQSTTDSIRKTYAATKQDSMASSDSIAKAISKLEQETVSLIETLRKDFAAIRSDTVTASETFRKLIAETRTDSVTTSDSLKKTANLTRQESIALSEIFKKVIGIRSYDVIVSTEVFTAKVPGPILIGTITLNGDRELYVYLAGEQTLYEALEGEVNSLTEPNGVLEGSLIMTASNQNFTMYSGNSKTLVVNITGDNVNLAGSTFTWILKENDISDYIILTKTNGSGITLPGGNKINIALAKADTNLLEGTYYHECKMVDSSGNESTLLVGTVTIKKSHI